jgi:hypothetical protein
MKTSTKDRSIAFALLAIIPAAILGVSLASTRSDAAGPQGSPPPQTAQYLPSISDMMIATIQPRHLRLWQAAQDRNWEFAAYELGNLHGAFKRLGEAHPVDHDMPFQDMIASVTEQPFKALDTAIKSKDEIGFSKAYADLTEGCNSCHQALSRGVVVIRVPSGTSVSDQDFTSPKP